ncbi:glycerophosphodiester phosphodiesterase [Anaerobacillus arseniciselenatis]|uniref:Glycerophosphodiester phosphodiesterase n=1 Tax=Anaerobacillus arseniciselenatis TaxID=85682 RepID=A0A1S2LT55_9BACI|nr:glycerophosphodiester phosphodiesterase family protein [Anaerobacillus arseniciselenatis]OIJ15514.1 glycerophosphodiester phosphodiesterase [Anaerobacillus arseniciselenatis]
MFDVVKYSLDDFKVSYKKYLSFALLYMLLTSFLFVPLISFLFNRMLRILGTGSLLNAEVYTIALSPIGVITLISISFLAVVVLLIEFGVMILIAAQRYFSKTIFVSDAFVTTLRKLPRLVGFGFFQVIVLTLLFIPFIEFATFPALLDFNLPIFLTNVVYDASYFSIFQFLAILLIALFVLIRYIFTLHYIFIEERTIIEAMKCSWNLTKYNKLQIILNLLLLNVMIFVVSFLLVTLLSYIPTVAETALFGNIIKDYLITFASYMMILFSLLLIPINIIIITRLFYEFNKNQGDVVFNKLTIYSNHRLMTFENGIVRFFTRRKYTLASVVFVFITGMFFINDTLNDNIVYLQWNVQVAAHRGDAYNAPENSMSSIKSAIEKGVDAVEFDVMLSKDDVVILHHDDTLQRVADIPERVQDLTYDELSKIDIGRMFSEEFIGERIPTLDEVFEEFKEENVTFIVDLKPGDSSGNLAREVVRIIEKYEMEDKAYVQAFDYPSLQVVRKLNSNIKIGQILYLSAGNLADLDVDFYTIRQTMLTERFINNARAQNREVWVWTVNIERNMREVLKYDIDGIITGYPERAQNVLGINFGQE